MTITSVTRILTAFFMIPYYLFNFVFNNYAYPAVSTSGAYVFCYFVGNEVDEQTIHLAVSNDGYNFAALNNNEPIIKQTQGTGCVRDPYIYKTKDEEGKDCYYIVATDMDAIIANDNVQTIFPQCEKISIDYAVVEPAASDGLVYTHPADFGWSDLGNWQSLHEKLKKDECNNASIGNVIFHECSNCVVHAEDAKKVVLQGLENFIVSEKNRQILICKRSEEQRIKDLV